jgi:hypothetical protein
MQQTWQATSKIKNNGNGKNKKVTHLIAKNQYTGTMMLIPA